jgi:hypothetical protein
MSYYLLVNVIPKDNGFGPDLPDDYGFLCLSSIDGEQPFGLYRVTVPRGGNVDSLRAPRPLETLLASSGAYPPALAGAVRDVESLGSISRERFLVEMEASLRRRLDAQPRDRFVLARSRIDEVAYRSVGEYVWVVAYRPDRVGREVTWIADDYQVYADDIETFDLDPSWMATRFSP